MYCTRLHLTLLSAVRRPGPILDPEGKLYGTTPHGGVNFSGAPGGTTPFAGVARDPAGSIIGATQHGGAANCGVVYIVDSTGRQKALYAFTGGTGGLSPESTPVPDCQGNIYGTTVGGGAAGFGTAYETTNSGGETVLHGFTGDDGGPPVAVTFDSADNLYGAAGFYGPYDSDVIYKLARSGQFTVLYSFTGGAGGGGPGDLTLDSAGNDLQAEPVGPGDSRIQPHRSARWRRGRSQVISRLRCESLRHDFRWRRRR